MVGRPHPHLHAERFQRQPPLLVGERVQVGGDGLAPGGELAQPAAGALPGGALGAEGFPLGFELPPLGAEGRQLLRDHVGHIPAEAGELVHQVPLLARDVRERPLDGLEVGGGRVRRLRPG